MTNGLIVFSGLPGTGKTTLAREISRERKAVFLRIDTLEQGIREAKVVTGDLRDAGYRAAYGTALENLRLGHTVVADLVNPILLTREAWRAVAAQAQAPLLEIEVLCSDAKEHRRRVEERVSDVCGLRLPTWDEVVAREYHSWDREHLVVDTAGKSVEQCLRECLKALDSVFR